MGRIPKRGARMPSVPKKRTASTKGKKKPPTAPRQKQTPLPIIDLPVPLPVTEVPKESGGPYPSRRTSSVQFVRGQRAPSLVYQSKAPVRSFRSVTDIHKGSFRSSASFSSFRRSPSRKSSKVKMRYARQIDEASALRIQRWYRQIKSGKRPLPVRLPADGSFLTELKLQLQRDTGEEKARVEWASRVLRRFFDRVAQRLASRQRNSDFVHCVNVIQVWARAVYSEKMALAHWLHRRKTAVRTIENAWIQSPWYCYGTNGGINAEETRLLLRVERLTRRDMVRARFRFLVRQHQLFYNHPILHDTKWFARAIPWEYEVNNSVISYEVDEKKKKGNKKDKRSVGASTLALGQFTAAERSLLSSDHPPVDADTLVPSNEAGVGTTATDTEKEVDMSLPLTSAEEHHLLRLVQDAVNGFLLSREEVNVLLDHDRCVSPLQRCIQAATVEDMRGLSRLSLLAIPTLGGVDAAWCALVKGSAGTSSVVASSPLLTSPPLLLLGNWVCASAAKKVLYPTTTPRIKAIDSHEAARRDCLLREQALPFTMGTSFLGEEWRAFILFCCAAEQKRRTHCTLKNTASTCSNLPGTVRQNTESQDAPLSLETVKRRKYGVPIIGANGKKRPVDFLLSDFIPSNPSPSTTTQTTTYPIPTSSSLTTEEIPTEGMEPSLPIEVPYSYSFVLFVNQLERVLLRERYSRTNIEKRQREQYYSMIKLLDLFRIS